MLSTLLRLANRWVGHISHLIDKMWNIKVTETTQKKELEGSQRQKWPIPWPHMTRDRK